jgi:hypothetical protein
MLRQFLLIVNNKMVQLLSFDIGTVNMAYCFASVEENKLNLHNLNKIDLCIKKSSNTQKIIDTTIEFLEETINDLKINQNEKIIILIECQMTSIMRCIQTVINTYFKLIGKYEAYNIETVYVSPKHKLNIINKYDSKIATTNYKQNKNDAVFYTKYLLENTYKNNEFLTIFSNMKKKDDISDAFLMIIYYYENFIL